MLQDYIMSKNDSTIVSGTISMMEGSMVIYINVHAMMMASMETNMAFKR